MGFYYSSPLKGWLAWPLLPVLGLKHTWNLLLLASRVATVVVPFYAARAWGLGGAGALVVAATYGASPFFHGYAVEGIVEGTDGWTLACWAWAIGARRHGAAALAFAATLLSSWYLGMVACGLLGLAVLRDRRAAWSALGLLLAAPALVRFATAFPGTAPLEDAVRASMGAHLSLAAPGWTAGLNPFAITTWVGLCAPLAALASRSRWAWLALIPAALSLGIGPVYDLPVAELVRFPYRWHAGTLLLLGAAAGTLADRRGWLWLGPLIALEGLLLSPIEPVIPGAPAEIPALYARVDGPVLELPGPVALPPGQINRSRPRARYLLYFQTGHGQPSPWVPDFNSVGVTRTDGLAAFRSWDPLLKEPHQDLAAPLRELAAQGVRYVMVQRAELRGQASALERALVAGGACLVDRDDAAALYRTTPADLAGRCP